MPFLFRRLGTHIVPDRHDQHHGNGEGLVQLRPTTNLVEPVLIAEHLELVLTEFGGNSATGGDARESWWRNFNLLVVLDEELRDLVSLELGDDAEAKVNGMI